MASPAAAPGRPAHASAVMCAPPWLEGSSTSVVPVLFCVVDVEREGWGDATGHVRKRQEAGGLPLRRSNGSGDGNGDAGAQNQPQVDGAQRRSGRDCDARARRINRNHPAVHVEHRSALLEPARREGGAIVLGSCLASSCSYSTTCSAASSFVAASLAHHASARSRVVLRAEKFTSTARSRIGCCEEGGAREKYLFSSARPARPPSARRQETGPRCNVFYIIIYSQTEQQQQQRPCSSMDRVPDYGIISSD